MNLFEALILGLIQGLTEFLPVSSSGHLAIASSLLGIEGADNLMFAVAVHAATVLATVCVLWKEIGRLATSFFTFRKNADSQMVLKLLLSMIPVAIVGVFLKDYVEALFGEGLLLTGIMLLLTAVLLTFTYLVRSEGTGKVSFRDAFVIGIAQAVAVLPGLSRSGSTIATGILLGNRRADVAKFSFLMVIIPVLGEALLDIMKGDFSTSATGISPITLAAGFIMAFVSGAVACRWMLKLVAKGKLVYFAWYCVAAGAFAIVLSLVK